MGLRRGWIEVRHTLVNLGDFVNYVFLPAVFFVVMYFLRNRNIPGADFSLSSAAIPSVVGLQVALGGLMGLTGILIMEREDGTLLRAKATPNGMLGYLIGKVVTFSIMTVISVAIILVPGAFLFDGIQLGDPAAWLTLLWVLALGLLATMPLGAVIGSLFSNPRDLWIAFIPVMGLIAISGIFYPITALPGWLQAVGQVFPVYWLGLGMRSAFLPDSLASVEIGASWRHLEAVGVLGAWSVLGLVLAPIVLRRMARRESGSSVAERRDRAMSRGY